MERFSSGSTLLIFDGPVTIHNINDPDAIVFLRLHRNLNKNVYENVSTFHQMRDKLHPLFSNIYLLI